VIENTLVDNVKLPAMPLISSFALNLTQRVPLVGQELLTLQEHMSSPPVLVGFVLLHL